MTLRRAMLGGLVSAAEVEPIPFVVYTVPERNCSETGVIVVDEKEYYTWVRGLWIDFHTPMDLQLWIFEKDQGNIEDLRVEDCAYRVKIPTVIWYDYNPSYRQGRKNREERIVSVDRYSPNAKIESFIRERIPIITDWLTQKTASYE